MPRCCLDILIQRHMKGLNCRFELAVTELGRQRMFRFASTTTRPWVWASLTRKSKEKVKSTVSKWSNSDNEYSYIAISNNLRCKMQTRDAPDIRCDRISGNFLYIFTHFTNSYFVGNYIQLHIYVFQRKKFCLRINTKLNICPAIRPFP